MSETDGAASPRGWRIWWLGIRPRTLTLSLVPVVVGSALAWAEGAVPAWAVFVAAAACATLIQAGTNLHNDVADFERGNDRPDRIGPPRITAAGWATADEVRFAARLAFAASLAGGLYLVCVGGWPILAVGLVSILAGYAYSGGPRPISHTPFGEMFVLAFFGVAAVAGSHYLQSGRFSIAALVAGIAAGGFAAAVLLVNNHRDREADTAAGRRTLAVVLGGSRSRAAYSIFIMLPFAAAGGLWLLPNTGLPLALLALPHCLRLIRRMQSARSGPALNDILAGTARAQTIFGALLAIGFFLRDGLFR